MTKRQIALIFLLFFAAACTQKKVVTIEIANPLAVERAGETVEIPWDSLPGITPENAVVRAPGGEQAPSQVILRDGKPCALIFQPTVAAGGTAVYTVSAGIREDYTVQARGRFVPERKDDYVWENNVVAFRAYGPALENETSTPGIDVWCKRTPELIADKWYADGDYHTDHGQGLDCYKVGATLGGGASAMLIGGKPYVKDNFKSWETLDNGPLRTTVRLTYAYGDSVSLVRTISLDANSRFNRITEEYTFASGSYELGVGVARYDTLLQYYTSPLLDFIAVMEPATDSRSGTDGDIATAVIIDDNRLGAEVMAAVTPAVASAVSGNNVYLVKNVSNGRPLVYYAGSGWSKYGVGDMEQWVNTIEEFNEKLHSPLVVKY